MDLLKQNTLEKDSKWFAEVGELYENHRSQFQNGLSSDMAIQKTIHVAGFPIQVTDQELTDTLKIKIVQESKNSLDLKQQCKSAGIEPIAIIPEEIFDKVAEKAKLYQFHRIEPDGRVYGNGKNLFLGISEDAEARLSIISFVASITAWVVVAILGWWIPFGIMTISLVVLFFCSLEFFDKGGDIVPIRLALVSLILPFLGFYFWAMRMIRVLPNKIMPVFMNDYIKSKIWPHRNDIDGVKKDLFKIQLPEPPDSITLLLVKCHEKNLQVSLGLHTSAFKVILDNATINRLYRNYCDPIIFIKKNGMVAVLDQFGEFPEEKEVVNYIREHFDALRRDLLPIQRN